MRIHVADHPLVAHKLTTLRDERTDSPTFRRLADERPVHRREVREDDADVGRLAADRSEARRERAGLRRWLGRIA